MAPAHNPAHGSPRPARCDAEISAAASRVRVFIIATNEEIVVARKAKEFLETRRA